MTGAWRTAAVLAGSCLILESKDRIWQRGLTRGLCAGLEEVNVVEGLSFRNLVSSKVAGTLVLRLHACCDVLSLAFQNET
jgi:hypothetical protein